MLRYRFFALLSSRAYTGGEARNFYKSQSLYRGELGKYQGTLHISRIFFYITHIFLHISHVFLLIFQYIPSYFLQAKKKNRTLSFHISYSFFICFHIFLHYFLHNFLHISRSFLRSPRMYVDFKCGDEGGEEARKFWLWSRGPRIKTLSKSHWSGGWGGFAE